MSVFNSSSNPSKSNHRRSTKSSDAASPIDASAGAALKLLAKLASELHLDAAGRPITLAEQRAAARVPPDALVVAADIVASNPEKFGDFDAGALRSAGEYAQSMLPVLEGAESLVRALHKSIYNKRHPASHQALALHATLKGLGRMTEDAHLSAMADKLAAKLARNPKKKVSAAEQTARRVAKSNEKKVAKLESKLAAAKAALGKAPPPAPSPPPSQATAPESAPAPAGAVTVTVGGSSNLH